MAVQVGITLDLPEDNKFRGTYTLRLEECTGIDDLDCLRETNMTVYEVMSSLVTKQGASAIVAAVVLWLVRRRQFPAFTFRVAAEAVPWSCDFTLRDADEEEDEGKEQDSDGKQPNSESQPTSPTSTESDPGSSTN